MHAFDFGILLNLAGALLLFTGYFWIASKIPYSMPYGVVLYPKSEIEELIRKGIICGQI